VTAPARHRASEAGRGEHRSHRTWAALERRRSAAAKHDAHQPFAAPPRHGGAATDAALDHEHGAPS
jgi:hypothetical protein